MRSVTFGKNDTHNPDPSGVEQGEHQEVRPPSSSLRDKTLIPQVMRSVTFGKNDTHNPDPNGVEQGKRQEVRPLRGRLGTGL